MSPLSRVHLFEGLEPDALQRLERGALASEPANDTELFTQGDPADAVYAIVGGEGHVRTGAIDRRSKKLMVELFSLGDAFGEIGVLDGGHRTASALVDGRVRLLRINGAAFLAELGRSPALGLNLSRMLSQRLRRTFNLLQDAAFETVEVRLARQVLYMGEVSGRTTPAGTRVTTRLTQTDLADLMGATTRSMITILNAWRAADIVQFDPARAQITIRNEAALRAMLEG